MLGLIGMAERQSNSNIWSEPLTPYPSLHPFAVWQRIDSFVAHLRVSLVSLHIVHKILQSSLTRGYFFDRLWRMNRLVFFGSHTHTNTRAPNYVCKLVAVDGYVPSSHAGYSTSTIRQKYKIIDCGKSFRGWLQWDYVLSLPSVNSSGEKKIFIFHFICFFLFCAHEDHVKWSIEHWTSKHVFAKQSK